MTVEQQILKALEEHPDRASIHEVRLGIARYRALLAEVVEREHHYVYGGATPGVAIKVTVDHDSPDSMVLLP